MTPNKEYASFWHAALLGVVFLGVQGGLITPFVILDRFAGFDLMRNPTVLGVVNLFACAAVVWPGWLIGRRCGVFFSIRPMSLLSVLAVIVASGGAMILVSESDNLVRSVLPAP